MDKTARILVIAWLCVLFVTSSGLSEDPLWYVWPESQSIIWEYGDPAPSPTMTYTVANFVQFPPNIWCAWGINELTPGWLVEPSVGFLWPQEQEDFDVSYVLPWDGQVHNGSCDVFSNFIDPLWYHIEFSVDCRGPQLWVHETTFNLSWFDNVVPPQELITIRNSGYGTMNWNTHEYLGWVDIDPESGTLGTDQETEAIIHFFNPGPPGEYSGTFEIFVEEPNYMSEIVSVNVLLLDSTYPQQFSLSSPPNGSTVNHASRTCNLSWEGSSSPGGIHYNLDWSLSPTFDSYSREVIPGGTTTYQLTNLQYEHNYYWRVKAVNDYGELSTWANGCGENQGWSFFLHSSRPEYFSLDQPQNGTIYHTDNYYNSANVSWTASYSPHDYFYRIVWSQNSDFSNADSVDVSSETLNYTINNLVLGIWYWKVTAIDQNNGMTFADPAAGRWFRFDPNPPMPFSLLLPENGHTEAVHYTPNTVTFTWAQPGSVLPLTQYVFHLNVGEWPVREITIDPPLVETVTTDVPGYNTYTWWVEAFSDAGSRTSNTHSLIFTYDPVVSIEVEPINPPINLPGWGGQFFFNVRYVNHINQTVTADLIRYLRRPDGHVFDGNYRFDRSIGPYEVIDCTMRQYVGYGWTRGRWHLTESVRAYDPNGNSLPEQVGGFYFTIHCGPGPFIAGSDEWLAAAGQVPTEFRVGAPHPNPFNSIGQFQIELPQATLVNCILYNILGEQVLQVANSTFAAGYHDLTIDGSHLSSGVYILVTELGNSVHDTQRVVLLK